MKQITKALLVLSLLLLSLALIACKPGIAPGGDKVPAEGVEGLAESVEELDESIAGETVGVPETVEDISDDVVDEVDEFDELTEELDAIGFGDELE